MWRRVGVLTAVLLLGVVPTAIPALAARADRAPLQVGSVRLRPCATSDLAWCATIQVPFDHDDPTAGTTGLYVEWFPATESPVGTVLTVQGGPGYASTDYRADYLAMLGPLTRTRNVLIADLRGTGRSDAVDCRVLQRWQPSDGNQAYIDAVGACGTRLNHERQRPDGTFVRGSELYTTANAARDIALLLTRLRTGPVDLYGDSYGTYFGQVFLSRFPEKLRSVTLDAAYPVLGADPFYPDAIRTARAAFNDTCARSPACAGAAPGASWSRISALVRRVRAQPIRGEAIDAGGNISRVTITPHTVADLVTLAGSDSGVYRELDPAIRALLDHGDQTPILRLVAQSIWTGDAGEVREFSSGLYVANACNDYPQPFSYAGSYAQRLTQYRAAVAALPDDAFAPFTVEEWVTSPSEEFDACLRWPAPVDDDPPITRGTPLAPGGLPVLVLSGELDSLTTPAEGQRVARQVGPSARWVQVGNMIHVSAMLDYVGCAEGLVREFIRRPDRLARLDTSCARRMPEVRVVGSYPRTLPEAIPAHALPDNQADADALRLAAIGAAAVGDMVWHWWYIPGNRGVGLRAGTFRFTGDGPSFGLSFQNLRWTGDVRVDGTGRWHLETGRVTADLLIRGPGGRTVTATLTYDDYAQGATAHLTGTANGVPLNATLPAP